jgi:curved DNA-binding protein CbpA
MPGNHFEVLGVQRGASDLEIREAYFRLVRQFHPDRHAEPALADLKKELEALFIRIGEAYEVLGHPRRRARYEAELTGPLPAQSPEASGEVENALLADDAIRRAEQFMEESQYWDAIQILEAVIPQIQSSRLKHEAQVRLARAYTRNPKWVRRGEELLQTVLREDPSWVDAYYVLGTIYRGNGFKSRAVAMFKKVLELRPSHRPAAAEIRSLEGPPETKKPLRRT